MFDRFERVGPEMAPCELLASPSSPESPEMGSADARRGINQVETGGRAPISARACSVLSNGGLGGVEDPAAGAQPYGEGLGERLGGGLGAFEGLAGALGATEPEGAGDPVPLPDGLAAGEAVDGDADT